MSAAQPAAVPNRALITISIMLATVIQVLDSTVANVALPEMQASLGAAQDTITWVLTSYIVASAIATPITGWLADHIGMKRLFLVAIGGFVITSMLCGIATHLGEMVLFRLAQGMFGAFLVPLSQTVLLNINPKEKHGQAMALWGVGIMVGPIMGPVLGGWLTDAANWRWVFYINLPVGALAFAGVWLFLPRQPAMRRDFDLFGFALLAIAVGALQLMLDRGEQLEWFASWEIRIEMGLAIAAFWMFGVHVATGRNPLLSLQMLRDRNLVTALLFIFAVGILLLAGMALMPPMLQRLFGYPTVATGLVLAPRGIGTMISMFAVGRLIGRIDARLLIMTGLVLMAASLWQMAHFTLMMDMRPIIISGIVQGLGLGLIFTPLTTLAFATLPAHQRTDATSLFSLSRNLGSSVGISLVTTLLARNMQVSHADLASHVTPFNLPLVDPGLAAAVGQAGDAVMSLLNAEITRQALMVAYIDDFKFMTVMTVALMPLVLLLRQPAAPDRALHVATE